MSSAAGTIRKKSSVSPCWPCAFKRWVCLKSLNPSFFYIISYRKISFLSAKSVTLSGMWLDMSISWLALKSTLVLQCLGQLSRSVAEGTCSFQKHQDSLFYPSGSNRSSRVIIVLTWFCPNCLPALFVSSFWGKAMAVSFHGYGDRFRWPVPDFPSCWTISFSLILSRSVWAWRKNSYWLTWQIYLFIVCTVMSS